MRVLITGAAGLVGRNLAQRIINSHRKEFDKIRLVFNKSDYDVNASGVTAIYGDLTNPEFCKDVTENIDVIYHCAAASFGAAIMNSNPLALVTPNVIMNTILMEAAYRNKVKKFIWLASTTGYPNLPGLQVTEDQMFEGDPYDKYFAVGWTKRFGEKLCELYSTKLTPAMQCVVLRPSNIYGPYDKYDFGKCHVLPALIRRFAEKQNPFEVWGDGSETRDFIYVDDMVDAILLATQTNEFIQANIGSGTQYSINDVIKILSEITGFQPNINYIGGKPTMIPSREISIEKAKEKLAFKPITSLETGLSKTLGWYLNETAN